MPSRPWCWEVLARANTMPLPTAYKSGTVDLEFLLKVVKLSWSEAGPRLAQEFLGKHGIHLVCVEHLPRNTPGRRCAAACWQHAGDRPDAAL